jgi:hypothetical protein
VAEEDIHPDQDQMLFLITCRALAEEMIDVAVGNLETMSEDKVHVLLLDDLWSAEENGVSSTQFQNVAAAVILLAAIERKKTK